MAAQRKPTLDLSSAGVGKWQSMDPRVGQWVDYTPTASQKLEQQFQAGVRSQPLQVAGQDFQVELSPRGFRQVNSQGLSRAIRRDKRCTTEPAPSPAPVPAVQSPTGYGPQPNFKVTSAPLSGYPDAVGPGKGLMLPLQTMVISAAPSNGTPQSTPTSSTSPMISPNNVPGTPLQRMRAATMAAPSAVIAAAGSPTASASLGIGGFMDFSQGSRTSASLAQGRPRAATVSGSTPLGFSPTASAGLSFFPSSPPTLSDDVLMMRGQPYNPSTRSVIVIGPGGGTRMNAPAYDRLRQAGWDLTVCEAPDYDRSPAHPDFLYPPGWEQGRPDLNFNSGKNLATLADNVVMPKIDQLIKAGRGPAAVIVGSRGGQVTLPRLWACGWRGPVLCINGGCVKPATIPGAPVRLILLTFGQDFFETKDSKATAAMLRKEDQAQPVLLYHDKRDGHMPATFGDVAGPLLEIATSEDAFAEFASRAATQKCMLPQPQAQKHGVNIKVL